MRNTLLSRSTATAITPAQPSDIPSIRLIAATPSASGMSSEASTSMNSSWASVPSVPSPIAPKADAAPSRKRLVPKKSKLGLLSNKDKEMDRGKDLSDVVRRVGGSTSRRGFEIYVDPTDPEIGEVVVVKKKKSRAGLDGLRWGSGNDALQEVTNIPSVTATLKVKTEEKERWWTIGRGRKDSKEKEKEKEKEKIREKSKTRPDPPRSKTPEPFKSAAPETQSRARFNSLDSGMLLSTAPSLSLNAAHYKSSNNSTPQLLSGQLAEDEDHRNVPSYSRAGTPTLGGLLAPLPAQAEGTNPSQNQNSIAIRAMRSVRSLARIGSWAQLKNSSGPGEDMSNAKDLDKKEKPKVKKDESKKKTKKKKEERKEKKEKKERPATVRHSTSSFEAGALTASPDVKMQSLGKKKRSILGLGLPSTMRLPTVRSGSTTSSIGIAEGAGSNNNRLSVESAVLMAGRMRSGSVLSTGSSLRPMSTTSSTSRASSSSSAVSVKWDEEGLETVKELRRKEKEIKRNSEDGTETERKRKKTNRESRESRRSSEGRRRTPLSDIFPGIHTKAPESPATIDTQRGTPLLTLEEATSDGHEKQSDSAVSTPVKRARPRPLSEQLLGRTRPQGIHEDDGDGVISILSAATNDLAQLINYLDLEATPGTTPGATPGTPDASWKRPVVPTGEWSESNDSPTKKTLRKDITSISSLRPYAQSRSSTLTQSSTAPNGLVGQQIAPWPTLNAFFPQKDSPAKAPIETSPIRSKARLTHKRTMSPPAFNLESSPAPALRALRPAKSRAAITSLKPLGPPPALDLPPVKTLEAEFGTVRAPSSLTFGSRSSSRGGDSSISSMDDVVRERPPNPVLRPVHGHARNRSSVLSSQQSGSQGSISEEDYTTSRPLAPGARRMLGMKGTMGGSDVSAYAVDDLDASDPDSDIPDELQFILSGQSEKGSDDTLSFHPRSPSPSEAPLSEPNDECADEPEPLSLPIFHAQVIDADDNCADLDLDDMATEEEDTKKSFDFTGELKKLNESGGSDRRSFVEQLENAFRTPAKIDLRYDFVDTFIEVPPVPALPSQISDIYVNDSSCSTLDTMASGSSQEAQYGGSSQSKSTELQSFSISKLLDTKEPTLLPGSDSIGTEDGHDLVSAISAKGLKAKSSSGSRPSDGELNTSFKFGGLSKPPSTDLAAIPLTLSDIIPPPSHVRTMSNASSLSVDDSVINSIMAKAEVPAVRPRLNSDSSSKRRVRDTTNTSSIQYRHSRHSSGISFNGFDSFEEVRRGFEFNDYRPSFYPPPVTSAARRNIIHGRQDSVMSFASISSYGHVVNPGVPDPFDYGLPSLRERPSSEDMSSISMSMTVDDTFSFLNHRPQRRRVESDASSFYFNAPSRGHRRHDSNMSVISQGPPISLYNRSYGGHRRNDSSTSVSSMAHSYAMHGASGGRAAWARHRQDASVDSVDSQFSAMRLGRPGIGDKMFDTANHSVPLASISASPPDSHMAERMDMDSGDMYSGDSGDSGDNRSMYDSILDDDRRSSMEDSLFDKTGHRTSVSSESVFGYEESQYAQGDFLLPNSFRPASSMSVTSVHSPMKEDDTMISMLGGGHVRRRSVGSVIEASPCVRVGKRKQPPFETLKGFKGIGETGPAVKARIIEKPSIASTASSKFGDERMIRARRGILERQSLEESCLIAEGEDLSLSFQTVPAFSRPGPASRSRSSTCTSSSSGGDTPPLSPSVGSSASDGSQSSIDLSHVNMMLANATHPMTHVARNRIRARARGQGHRRRISQARASRSSVYETIEEEMSSVPSSPVAPSAASKKSSPTAIQPVFIVEPDTASIHSTESFWDDERGIVALRRYYELRDEAEYTVMESKRVWVDTPFSLYALQGFQPPRHPAGMQALLTDSQQSYGPLPSDLRPRRRRTSSRPSPYPQRIVKVSVSPESVRPSGIVSRPSVRSIKSTASPPLQSIPVNLNIDGPPPVPALTQGTKVFFPPNSDIADIKAKASNVGPNAARPRVASTARRTALGWSKRSSGKTSSDLKENSFGQGVGMTPSESLRLSRPRPRGRPTPARAIRA